MKKALLTDVLINSAQVDLLISAILVCSCSITWCLGFLAHEMGGK